MLYLYMKNGILTAATYVQKGGVGKTTTAAHVAVAAAQNHDLNTLLIDLAGTQNDLATHFGISIDEESIDAPISAVFGDQWELIRNGIDNVVERMTFDTGEGPVLIPADPGLGAADNNLANVPREERYDRLADFIAEDLAATYDFVLVDLPGKEDNIAISGLYAVEDVIAPLRPGAFERNQLENLEADLQEIRDAYPVDPRLAMVLPTMIDRRTTQSSEFVADIREAYPDIAGLQVVSTQNIGDYQEAGSTLFAVDDDELYSTGQEALDAYSTATDQLLQTLRQ
ncbi:chromosome partitioning protein [Halohasta litchfieldiae]|jgi:chromosome partitioning protein|uniref:Chromosome partitioning protein ParA n=3 Tax=Halobacteriales TaxID=2235 RepID=B9LW06_HALLT|nr:chromosome partitioning protein ParA [Halorubrum lacusprofundi ATCC 49239]ATW88720.1 chromosome partitioning protein [Halohasta litchfieldiae]SEJ28664.1 chromosome partitioning protein [Halohasta litchfieldiae]